MKKDMKLKEYKSVFAKAKKALKEGYDRVGDVDKNIMEFLKDQVKSVDFYYSSSETGQSFDLKDHSDKSANKFLDEMFEKAGFLFVGNDWDEDDEDGTLMKELNFDIANADEASSGNTYNSSWLFPAYVNWRVYEDKENDRAIGELRIGLHSDPRGGYTGGYYQEYRNADEASQSILEMLFIASISLSIEFKDGSSIILDAQQTEDVYNFEVYQKERAKRYGKEQGFLFDDPEFQFDEKEGAADLFEQVFTAFDRHYGDDFAMEVAGVY